MARKFYDYWVLFKYNLRIPLPLKNHYYKGKRIKEFEIWFCKNCCIIFWNKDWNNKENRHIPISKLKNICPNCGSKRITCSKELAKAIIEKQSTEYIIKLVASLDEENRLIEERIKARKAKKLQID